MYFNAPPIKWLIVIFFLVIQCKSIPSSSDPEKELQKLIIQNIGTEYTTFLNESKTFILCVQSIPLVKAGSTYVNYLVVELKSNHVAAKGKFLNGHCQWNDDSSIEVVDMPGIVKENQPSDFKKIISLIKPKL